MRATRPVVGQSSDTRPLVLTVQGTVQFDRQIGRPWKCAETRAQMRTKLGHDRERFDPRGLLTLGSSPKSYGQELNG